MCILKGIEGITPFPGEWLRSTNKNCGKCLPPGCFKGATVHATKQELATLANILHAGAGHSLTSWEFFLDDDILRL